MLSDYMVHPSLATANIDKARGWYAERLGLNPLLAFPNLLAYQVGPTIFTVFESPGAGTAQNTDAIWRVPDLGAEISRLRSRGVVFAEVDEGGADRTIDEVAFAVAALQALGTGNHVRALDALRDLAGRTSG
jgi:catechol 2,3-dioxygenase-like lactoylglutathione lyase family enzyme